NYTEVVFLFPGQGSQYVGMAEQLYQSMPLFKRQIDICCNIVRQYSGIDLHDVLFKQGSGFDISETELAHPALFVIEYSLAKLLINLGIKPFALIGHSLGEYVAACIAEVFSLEDAIRLVCTRGRLIQSVLEGKMLSVTLSQEHLKPYLLEFTR